jgi:phage baseplate assembly protein W
MARINSLKSSLSTRLGSDTKFPISGNFQTISGQDVLLQDIQMLLLTIPGERPMRPDFGCNLRNQIWENESQVVFTGAAAIRESLLLFEPRITVVSVTGNLNENTGLITFNISFVIKTTDTALNLIFPFRVGTQLSFS